MPIDASIPLQARPPQMPNLLDSFSRAQTLRNQEMQGSLMEQQGMIGQQTVAENQMKLQQQRKAEADRDLIRNLYLETGGDPDSFLKQLRTSGVSPETVMGLEKTFTEQKQSYMNLGETERRQQMEKYDRARAMLAPISDLDDDGKAGELFNQTLTAARAMGLIDEQAEEGLRQIMPNGFTRDGLRILQNSLTTGTKIAQEAEKELRAQAAMLRAQSYSQSIQDRIRNTDLRDERERQKLEQDMLQYERLLDKDKNLDDVSRLRITNDLEIARMRIEQAREEEKGRSDRFYAGEAGKTARLNISEQGKTVRQKDYLAQKDREAAQKGITPQQMVTVLQGSLKAMGLNSLDDLKDDNLSEFQNLFDAFMSVQQPQFGVEPSGLFGWGRSTTVAPGPPLNQGVFPQGQPPQGFIPDNQPMQVPPLPPGKVYVSGADGDGLFELPEAQLDDYLRANPNARAFKTE